MSVAAARARLASRSPPRTPDPAVAAGPSAESEQPRPTSRRVRLLRVLGLVAVFAGLAAWYGPWRRPDLWRQGPIDRLTAWRHAQRCLSYTAAADHPVCEVGPPESKDWFSAGDNVGGRGALVESAAAGFLARSRTPDCLTELLRPRNRGPSRAAVLVHRMKPPGSPPQLVVAYHVPVLNDSAPRGASGAVEGSDHTTRNGWPVPYRQYVGAMFPWVAPGRVLRLYAAQPDAKDAAHFTYAYTLDGGRGVVDAWLRNDDRLHWTVRDGPALDAPERADAGELPPPASVSVAEFRRGIALVTWSTPGVNGNPAGYEVAFVPAATAANPARRAWPGGTTAAATADEAWAHGLVPDTTYAFRVRAWRGNTYSDWATTEVTTPPPGAAPRVRVGADEPTTRPSQS